MDLSKNAVRTAGVMLLGLGLGLPSLAAAEDDLAELKRAIAKLQAENQEMKKRLSVLEAERAKRTKTAQPQPAPGETPTAPEPKAAQAAPPPPSEAAPTPPARTAGGKSLEDRVRELELAKPAEEESIRTIIRNALAGTGSRINEFVTLGGSLEVVPEHSTDFTGKSKDAISLSTAELDFEIKANDWMTGNLTVSFESATSVLFPTTPSFNTNVDRFTVDKGYVTIGDTQRFPLYARAGQEYLAFGSSTGVHRADTLSIVNPLTVEAFEIRAPGIGVGFAFPTPPLGPPSPPVVIPPVRPLVVNPLVSAFARGLGYRPPPVAVKPPKPVTLPPEPPPIYGLFTVYDPNGTDLPQRSLLSAFNGRLGYRTGGHCGRAYEQLTSSWVCPWAVDVTVDYDSSIFDSRFLQSEYQPFLSQIGTVPGMAGTARLSFGPFAVTGEWNGAVATAHLVDGANRTHHFRPSAWQLSLGYQFDWNPFVEAIGSQGDFVSVAYSQSHDLAGVVPPAGTTTGNRIGTVPQKRLALTVGEWVLDNAKIAIEYSHNWDYSVSQGGTGKESHGIFGDLTYNW